MVLFEILSFVLPIALIGAMVAMAAAVPITILRHARAHRVKPFQSVGRIR